MPRVKGPFFKSFDNPPDARFDSQKRYVFAAGTQSMRQVKKNLRNRVRHIIDAQDEQIIYAGDRCIRAVCAEPDPEYAALHLFCAALDASNDTGESWAVCMNYLMDQFDKRDVAQETAADDTTKPPETGTKSGSLLSRLLRSLVPRPLRQSDEAAAKADVDQHASSRDAQPSQCDADNRPQSAGESPRAVTTIIA
jgi:hypothetical protein